MNTPPRQRLPRTVVIVGLISLFNDFASEMVTPLIPLLLATVLAAGPLALGVIEGGAEAVSNLLKLWSGRRSDQQGRRRKPYIVGGYLLSNLVRPLIALSTSWFMVLALRITDRVGKGLRTAPRDALIADVITPDIAGRAYGFTRALDHGGAVLGALTAAVIIYSDTAHLDTVIALSAIPGIVTLALVVFGLREITSTPSLPKSTAPTAPWQQLSPTLRMYLRVLGVFTLARIPESFVLLRGHELAMTTVELLLLWAAMHVMKVGTAEWAGRLADRHGRRPIILAGWLVYAASLSALAFAQTPIALSLLSLTLGLYFGLTEGAERAFVRDLAADNRHGTAFGWYHMIAGLAAIPGGLLLGGLWALAGVKYAFLTSAVLAVLATFGFWRVVR